MADAPSMSAPSAEFDDYIFRTTLPHNGQLTFPMKVPRGLYVRDVKYRLHATAGFRIADPTSMQFVTEFNVLDDLDFFDSNPRIPILVRNAVPEITLASTVGRDVDAILHSIPWSPHLTVSDLVTEFTNRWPSVVHVPHVRFTVDRTKSEIDVRIAVEYPHSGVLAPEATLAEVGLTASPDDPCTIKFRRYRTKSTKAPADVAADTASVLAAAAGAVTGGGARPASRGLVGGGRPSSRGAAVSSGAASGPPSVPAEGEEDEGEPDVEIVNYELYMSGNSTVQDVITEVQRMEGEELQAARRAARAAALERVKAERQRRAQADASYRAAEEDIAPESPGALVNAVVTSSAALLKGEVELDSEALVTYDDAQPFVTGAGGSATAVHLWTAATATYLQTSDMYDGEPYLSFHRPPPGAPRIISIDDDPSVPHLSDLKVRPGDRIDVAFWDPVLSCWSDDVAFADVTALEQSLGGAPSGMPSTTRGSGRGGGGDADLDGYFSDVKMTAVSGADVADRVPTEQRRVFGDVGAVLPDQAVAGRGVEAISGTGNARPSTSSPSAPTAADQAGPAAARSGTGEQAFTVESPTKVLRSLVAASLHSRGVASALFKGTVDLYEVSVLSKGRMVRIPLPRTATFADMKMLVWQATGIAPHCFELMADDRVPNLPGRINVGVTASATASLRDDSSWRAFAGRVSDILDPPIFSQASRPASRGAAAARHARPPSRTTSDLPPSFGAMDVGKDLVHAYLRNLNPDPDLCVGRLLPPWETPQSLMLVPEIPLRVVLIRTWSGAAAADLFQLAVATLRSRPAALADRDVHCTSAVLASQAASVAAARSRMYPTAAELRTAAERGCDPTPASPASDTALPPLSGGRGGAVTSRPEGVYSVATDLSSVRGGKGKRTAAEAFGMHPTVDAIVGGETSER